MIQVVYRIDKIIDVIVERGGVNGVSLKVIEDVTGLNKGTLCNILKSLCDIDYVEKRKNGVYGLGKKLRKISYPYFQKDTLYGIAAQISKELATATRESAMIVGDFGEGKLRVIAKEIFDQAIVINSGIFEDFNNYHTATGYIVLAFDDKVELKQIYNESMSDKFDTYQDFLNELATIKKNRICELSVPHREATAFAVPVFKGEQFIASLGMLVPNIRCSDETQGPLQELLIQYGHKMTDMLS